MLQLKNATPFAANIMLLPDATGIDTVYLIAKGTFTVGEKLTIADEQVPVAMADLYRDSPATSAIRVPSDVCLGKAGTDVMLVGSAWAAGGQPVWQSDVSLSVGPVAKTVRVFGDRAWKAGPSGARPAWIAPFVRMPLVWERAFGGFDQTENGVVAYRRNPVGLGFRAPGGMKTLDSLPLPNVEDPAAQISSPKDLPTPAGFGPVAPHWEPRVMYAGTYDKAWQEGRAPYLPADFDHRFFQLAPAGLIAPGFLRGGEMVEVRGATANGILRFLIPVVRLEISYRLDRGTEPVQASLDTIIVEPDAARLVMVWRAALRCDKKALAVREVRTKLVT